MSRKTITLKGPAARAFIGMRKGTKPISPTDQYERVAVLVVLLVKSNQMAEAVELLKRLEKLGIDQVADQTAIERDLAEE